MAGLTKDYRIDANKRYFASAAICHPWLHFAECGRRGSVVVRAPKTSDGKRRLTRVCRRLSRSAWVLPASQAKRGEFVNRRWWNRLAWAAALVILFLNLKWPADCFDLAPWPGKP